MKNQAKPSNSKSSAANQDLIDANKAVWLLQT